MKSKSLEEARDEMHWWLDRTADEPEFPRPEWPFMLEQLMAEEMM